MIRVGYDVYLALFGASFLASRVFGNDCVTSGTLDPILGSIKEGYWEGASWQAIVWFQGVMRKHQGIETNKEEILSATVTQEGLMQVLLVVLYNLGLKILWTQSLLYEFIKLYLSQPTARPSHNPERREFKPPYRRGHFVCKFRETSLSREGIDFSIQIEIIGFAVDTSRG